MTTMNWMTPTDPVAMSWGPLHTGISVAHPSDELGMPIALSAESSSRNAGYTINRAYNQQGSSTANVDHDTFTSCREPTISTLELSESPSIRAGSALSALSPETPSKGEATLYVEGASTRLPFKGRCASNLDAASVVAHAASVVRDQDYSDICSPHVDGTDATSATSTHRAEGVLTGYLSAEAFSNLLQQVQSIFVAGEIDVSDGAFPMLGYVRAFLRLYFRRFHLAWPFLPPTLAHYEKRSRWRLLLAVIAVGSKYAPGRKCFVYSKLLCELLTKSAPLPFGEMQQRRSGEFCDDPNATDDLATLQALVLDVVCKTHDSQSSSPKEAFSQMFVVAETCRDMGLLLPFETPVLEQASPHNIPEWVDKQIRIRTGLMIWVREPLCLPFSLMRPPPRHSTARYHLNSRASHSSVSMMRAGPYPAARAYGRTHPIPVS